MALAHRWQLTPRILKFLSQTGSGQQSEGPKVIVVATLPIITISIELHDYVSK